MLALRLVFRALVTGPAKRRPLRFLLPVVGVGVGVAAVAAIHHANRSVTESFRDAAASISGRSDFTVTGAAGVPVGDLRALSFLWREGSFAPAVTGTVVLRDGSGEILDLLGVDLGGDSAVRDWKLVAPSDSTALLRLASEDGVLIPQALAVRKRLRVGDTLRVVAGGVPRSLPVAGVLAFSGVARAAGDGLLVAGIFTAQRILGKEGLVDRVDVVLRPGADVAAVRQRLASRLPAGLRIDAPNRSAASADRMVRAFRFNLNALGSLTLLVGVFLIANAVSISVLRRRPEIATLKAIGASRALLFGVFLVEGAAIGIAGTALGEAGGVFLARWALSAIGGTVSGIYLPAAKIPGEAVWRQCAEFDKQGAGSPP